MSDLPVGLVISGGTDRFASIVAERAEQNRAAQRAFRERKEQKLRYVLSHSSLLFQGDLDG